jgi:hypothetical protein
MMELLCSSETLVLTKSTWRNIPENSILQVFKEVVIACFKLLIELRASDRLLIKVVTYLSFPLNARNLFTGCPTLRYSR